MRNIKNHINASRLHFNRWSNTSFAVFHSIGREVVIGMVSGILEKLVTVKSSVVNGLSELKFKKAGTNDAANKELDEAWEDGLIIELFHSIIINNNLQRSFPLAGKNWIAYYKELQKAYLRPFLFPSILNRRIILVNNSQNNDYQ